MKSFKFKSILALEWPGIPHINHHLMMSFHLMFPGFIPHSTCGSPPRQKPEHLLFIQYSSVFTLKKCLSLFQLSNFLLFLHRLPEHHHHHRQGRHLRRQSRPESLKWKLCRGKIPSILRQPRRRRKVWKQRRKIQQLILNRVSRVWFVKFVGEIWR